MSGIIKSTLSIFIDNNHIYIYVCFQFLIPKLIYNSKCSNPCLQFNRIFRHFLALHRINEQSMIYFEVKEELKMYLIFCVSTFIFHPLYVQPFKCEGSAHRAAKT